MVCEHDLNLDLKQTPNRYGTVCDILMRLNHVTLTVSDVEISAKFYDLLGLTQIVANYPGYARFVAPDGDSTLSLQTRDTEARARPTTSIHFEVADVDRAVHELERRGVKFTRPPCDQPYLWREAMLLDPDGHEVFIYNAGKNRIDPPWRLGST